MKRFRPLVPVCLTLLLGACAGGSGPSRDLTLRRVVLYQNGIGYFERSGVLRGDRLRLSLRSHEVGDVLKSLMVIDRSSGRQRAVSAVLPQPKAPRADDKGAKDDDRDPMTAIDILLSEGGTHQLTVAYAVPTPIWKAAYRVVLPETDAASARAEGRGTTPAEGLLQGWALIDNTSGEHWERVSLTLATGAPLTFALDLRTPQYAARPDLTGQLVRPVATGAVFAEQADQTVDSDGDRIADVYDKCPNEPETYNGLEDEDGCPDRGRVIVRSSKIEILERIYFGRGSADLKPVSFPIADAIASVMKGNPQIQQIEIQGHASDEEPRGYEVAERRAAAVRSYLIQHGVEAARLTGRGYGPTRPVSSDKTEDGRSRNRRVEFSILKQRGDEDEERRRPPARNSSPISASSAAASARPSAAPQDVAGATRYQLSDPVTIPRGSSTMVSVINQMGGQLGRPAEASSPGGPADAVGAVEDIFLFRPDGNVPGSARHPLRAARLRPGQPLEAGPVAVFASGTFVGEGLIGRLRAGETAFVPYALDSSTQVKQNSDETRQPVRLVSLAQGSAVVEDMAIRSTRYEIAVGSSAPRRLFLRHGRRSGYTAGELPPGTESNDEAHLLPLPISAGKTSVITVEERKPERRTVALTAEGEQLTPYLDKTQLPAELLQRLRELSRLAAERDKLTTEIEEIRRRQSDLSDRSNELRESLRTIEKMQSAAALQRELLAKLQDASQKSEQASKQLVAKTEAQAAATARFTELLRDVRLAEPAPPK
jgi:outer membrane protein OmpA-like peptidoglycan-associated protein